MAWLLRYVSTRPGAAILQAYGGLYRNLLLPAGGFYRNLLLPAGSTNTSYSSNLVRQFASSSVPSAESPSGEMDDDDDDDDDDTDDEEEEEEEEDPLTEVLNAPDEKYTNEEVFEKWCQILGRTYPTDKEKRYRFKLFKRVLKKHRRPPRPYISCIINATADRTQRELVEARRRLRFRCRAARMDGVEREVPPSSSFFERRWE